MEDSKSLNHQYNNAAEIIKTAILQSQYEASKDVNRIQLGLYFSIGKFLSEKTRNAKWGANALQSISEKLQSDLPGLRGFSATNLKKMRTFYDNWKSLASKKETFSHMSVAESNGPLVMLRGLVWTV